MFNRLAGLYELLGILLRTSPCADSAPLAFLHGFWGFKQVLLPTELALYPLTNSLLFKALSVLPPFLPCAGIKSSSPRRVENGRICISQSQWEK